MIDTELLRKLRGLCDELDAARKRIAELEEQAQGWKARLVSMTCKECGKNLKSHYCPTCGKSLCNRDLPSLPEARKRIAELEAENARMQSAMDTMEQDFSEALADWDGKEKP